MRFGKLHKGAKYREENLKQCFLLDNGARESVLCAPSYDTITSCPEGYHDRGHAMRGKR